MIEIIFYGSIYNKKTFWIANLLKMRFDSFLSHQFLEIRNCLKDVSTFYELFLTNITIINKKTRPEVSSWPQITEVLIKNDQSKLIPKFDPGSDPTQLDLRLTPYHSISQL